MDKVVLVSILAAALLIAAMGGMFDKDARSIDMTGAYPPPGDSPQPYPEPESDPLPVLPLNTVSGNSQP